MSRIKFTKAQLKAVSNLLLSFFSDHLQNRKEDQRNFYLVYIFVKQQFTTPAFTPAKDETQISCDSFI
jgi:hypothetical protein